MSPKSTSWDGLPQTCGQFIWIVVVCSNKYFISLLFSCFFICFKIIPVQYYIMDFVLSGFWKKAGYKSMQQLVLL